MNQADVLKLNKGDLQKMIFSLQETHKDLKNVGIRPAIDDDTENQVVDLKKQIEGLEKENDALKATEADGGPKPYKIQFRVTEGVYKRLEHFANGFKVTPHQMAEDKMRKFLGFGEQYKIN